MFSIIQGKAQLKTDFCHLYHIIQRTGSDNNRKKLPTTAKCVYMPMYIEVYSDKHYINISIEVTQRSQQQFYVIAELLSDELFC